MRWLAGNGADTALAGLWRVEAKAVCALTPHPPHSKTLRVLGRVGGRVSVLDCASPLALWRPNIPKATMIGLGALLKLR